MWHIVGRRDREKEIIGTKPCKCGCGDLVCIRRWHLHPSKNVPEYIKGHGQKGNKYGWKGGKIKTNGYWMIYAPDHPNANAMGKGYVKQSRLKMEKKLKRILSRDEVVHHINGIRDDDRLSNLVVMTKEEHLSLHHKGRPKKRDKLGRFTKGV